MKQTIVRFTIEGPPMGKQRPRVVSRNGFSKAYTPQKTVSYENLVKWTYSTLDMKERLEGEIEAYIKAYYPIPKSMSKKDRKLVEEEKKHPTTKPDTDNVAKIILDSLNEIAYKDDSQIVKLTVEKYYSDKPRVEVRLSNE